MSEYDDAVETLRTVVLCGLIGRTNPLGVRAGPAMDSTIESVIDSLLHPSTRWVFGVIASRDVDFDSGAMSAEKE